MKNWMKIILGLFILGIMGAGLGYKFVYNKPHRDFEKATPDFYTNSHEFYFDYKDNKEEAQHKYNGKVVEIKGVLSKVETADSLTIAVFALEEGLFGDEGIRCTMLPDHALAVKSYAGKEITLKGFCAGYNDTDVILEKCSIVNENTN